MFGAVYSPSKTALNALTPAFSIELESTASKSTLRTRVSPKTDLNNNQGTGTVEEGAREAVRLALLALMARRAPSNTTARFPWEVVPTSA